jgi:iron-sulfur cluster repair protein YtfE (RIC family)
MDRNTVRNELLAQHERIREDVAECRALANRLRCGEPVEDALDLALARLRCHFDDHNRTETGLLLPLLLHSAHGQDTRGALLAERMIDEHTAEHAAFAARLDAPLLEVAAHFDDLVDELDAHMAAEERTFLSPLILRDDEIARIVPPSPATGRRP